MCMYIHVMIINIRTLYYIICINANNNNNGC